MTTVAPRHPLATDAAIQQSRGELLHLVEERMLGFLANEQARWQDVNARAAQPVAALTTFLANGGKRLRPTFCLSGYLAAGGHPANSVAVDAAAALELLQTFILIHDDIADNSSLRRGAPTVHEVFVSEHREQGWQGESRRFGEGVAVLAGDLAFVYADQLAERLPAPARTVWNEMRAELVIGQHLDMAIAAEGVVDPGLSRWVAVQKSGRYTIHRPLVLGATLAGRPDMAAAFEGYGLALGEAFQLRDDLIDAFGSTEDAGKPTGLDFAEHKMTLLLALAAERDPRVAALLDNEEGEPWDAELLRTALEESGVRAAVERTIANLVDKACASLTGSGLDKAWRHEFARLATQVAYRSH
ncbi:polyprenyl synthetase family protein [Streptomyces beihaiensis]|uniref:Polyprenyl synthetase family protein n=1 Tax=Streptomyces beihaiensis TaxID=2984495 RepID=A0ABT3TR03_9ACTN|nr:polyprenyl synthetase family protein [Streptomyces beihaiensis]MCX3059474.1 polyprenyl synthetase family protein [Streptomyces beihaiensis]